MKSSTKMGVPSRLIWGAIAAVFVMMSASADDCGSHIYLQKCGADCNFGGEVTEERCKSVLDLIEYNYEVLRRAECRARTYKDWQSDANAEARDQLRELLEQAKDTIPGLGEADDLGTLAGKVSFAGKVKDLLEMQGTTIQFLVNAQGSGVFEGMLRAVRNEIFDVNKEIEKALFWYSVYCPPPGAYEEEIFDEPLDPAPPQEEEEPETVTTNPGDGEGKKDGGDGGEGGDLGQAELPEIERWFFDKNQEREKIDFRRHKLTADQWDKLLKRCNPMEAVGFVRGVQAGRFDALLGSENIQVLRSAHGIDDLDVSWCTDEFVAKCPKKEDEAR